MKISNIQLKWGFERSWYFVFILSLLSLGARMQLWEGMDRGRKIKDLGEMKELIS